jgi:hypothetical protein
VTVEAQAKIECRREKAHDLGRVRNTSRVSPRRSADEIHSWRGILGRDPLLNEGVNVGGFDESGSTYRVAF